MYVLQYVLTVMQMLKYGLIAASVVAPALAHFKLVEGIDAFQKDFNSTDKSLGAAVDDAIRAVNDQMSNPASDIGTATGKMHLDEQEILNGADLRQLELFLNVKDKGRVLGNLNRIVTREGHVKWVCFDHFDQHYRQSAVQRLRDVVDANDGNIDEEEGEIHIYLASSTLATQFYEALVRARGIQTLKITMDWDASMDDLRTLAAAVNKANIANLDLDLSVEGCDFNRPTLDYINRGSRYDPIMELMFNNRIQSLKVVLDW